MTSSYDIIRSTGHMTPQRVRLKDGRTISTSDLTDDDVVAKVVADSEWITDEVVIQMTDGDDVVLGRGPTEKKALAAAKAELKRFRAEQKRLSSPRVVAAREELAAALREAEGH